MTSISTPTASGDAPAPTPPAVSDGPPAEPNCGLAAAFLAAGVGCAALGAGVVLTSASEKIATLMTLSEAVGPLSGKSAVAVTAWVTSWLPLHLALRHRVVSFAKVTRTTFLLVALGLVGTFPPFFQQFEPRHAPAQSTVTR
jgi:hypothetical protein